MFDREYTCGFNMLPNSWPSVFEKMLNNMEGACSTKEIIELLKDTTKKSYTMDDPIIYHYLPAETLHASRERTFPAGLLQSFYADII